MSLFSKNRGNCHSETVIVSFILGLNLFVYRMPDMFDAANDSDDEADFSKMDLGNKKGPVKRWDFETAEEYESYMSQREALPKAAFQYGIKMSGGRKTRKDPGATNKKTAADEKAKLDREWQKISSMIEKRKQGGGESSSSAKKMKY